MAIIDADGNAKVQYTYDAWGKILSISGPMADTLGAVNPLTYRGYVYDAETDLYYLQSRYYDPAVGRFINGDAYASTGGLLGNNMFAYCLNCPVNQVDPDGYSSIWYYLMCDSDWGFVHRMVQLHIKLFSGQPVITEVVISNRGRADIVNKLDHTVWEVKHASNCSEIRTQVARGQATRYVGGTYSQGTQAKGTIRDLGNAGAFSGSFTIFVPTFSGGAEYYQVSYWTPENGVVLYSTTLTEKTSGWPFAQFQSSSVEIKDEYMAFGQALSLGIAIVVVGGLVSCAKLECGFDTTACNR